MANYPDIKDPADFKKKTNADKVLIEFAAPWCNQSELQALILDTMISQNTLTTPVYRCDTDQLKECADIANVHAIPSLVIFEQGRIIKTLLGVQPACTIIQNLQ